MRKLFASVSVRGSLVCLFAAVVLFPFVGATQSFTLTQGVATYSTLTNGSVVTLSNRCELRVTATSAPITGCTIYLNSPDTTLVLPGIKPSVAATATYMNQVRVNGAVAVADVNCRVVQYSMGAIIVPHASSFQPLTVFSGPHFTGTSSNLSQYIYYKGAGLGTMNANISSFRLKRGYMVTIAQNESGAGVSRNYVAQDGDIEVSVLPDDLDDNVRFVFVTAWRWSSKKGIAGNIESGLNLQWKYNWNNSENSTRDVQYIPIRQDRWWPGLGSDWKARGSDHVLGYNEPDRPDQANMPVADAISSWPDLLATGLRVGAPAVSDGGRDWWLYPFMNAADAADLRVDYVPVHYYWCFTPSDPNGAATQMYNFLKATYDVVKRPLWITEWNNGANWTGCGDPSSAQQAATIAAIINMLDNTPFVERYAPYNWVEDVRRLKWDDGSLTSAGVNYRDNSSPLAYLQALPGNETRAFTQLRFETNTLDTSGYANNAVAAGSPAFTNGVRGDSIVFDGANTVITLPPNVATGSSFTFAAWINWDGGGNNQRIFDFGNSDSQWIVLTPKSSANTMRFKIKNGGTEHTLDTTALTANQWNHVAVTLGGGTARIFLNGAIVASGTGWTISPGTFDPRVNFLGDSQFVADPLFKGMMDEVLITDYAIGVAQMAALQTNNAPQFTNNVFAGAAATEGIAYNYSLAGRATDADAGDTLTFSKTIGPAWVTVADDGTVSGVPTSGDGGTNFVTVRVVDVAGQNSFALLTIPVTTVTAAGIWTADTSANWSEPVRWSNNIVATGAGQTANFSTINITGNRTVTLNTSRSIGTLRFGDTSGAQTWTLTNSGGSTLTLSTGTSTSPSLVVTNTATISAPLAGTNGFVKSGPGTLILRGNNPLSGTVFVDTASTTVNDGNVRVVGPGALANASQIKVRNNNSGTSTLQLDGSTGDITINAQFIATCRNNTAITFQNLAGTNIINGDVLLEVGGNSHNIQSDAGLLVFTGTNRFIGSLTGARSYNFSGAGHHLLVGPILNSTNGSPIGLLKTNAGSLTLEAVNTYGNGTTLAGGSLIVNGSLPAGTFTISSGTTLGGSGIIYPAVTLPSGATLAPGASTPGKLTLNANTILSAGSTTRMELNKAIGTNDHLRVNAALTYGGSLIVTNHGGQLWAGDAFHLFDATTRSGSFSSTNLPALPAGLLWSFNPNNGVLMVVTQATNAVPPLAPTALAAVGNNASVSLSWQQSATAGITTNRIYRSTTGAGGAFSLLASLSANTAYTDAAVVNGSTYHYVVTAVSTNGESAFSLVAGATPEALSAYVADADTLILFHLDEPAGTSVVTNHGTLSSTPADKLAYTVNQLTSTTNPPLVTTVLGASAYAGFGTAANLSGFNGHLIAWDANNSGAYQADAGSSPLDAVSFSTFNIGNGGQTPWTIEALIFPTNATALQPRASEILCTDSSAASRGFQFRLTTAGQLEMNFITGTSGGNAQQLVAIPTSGAHAYAANNWFHVAASYDGASMRLYWTKLSAATTAANLLTNYPLVVGPTVGAITGPLIIGGENRGANTETFPGSIDEVRISSTARGADGFLWQTTDTAPHAPIDLDAAAGDTQVTLGWSLVTNAVSYNLKRATTPDAPFVTVTNVTDTTVIDAGLVNATAYHYVVSALNSNGESVNSAAVSATPISLAPVSLTATVVGNQLQLDWPSSHLGWRVLTNSTDLMDTNAWFVLPGSSVTNLLFVPVNAADSNVFFRLTYP